MRKTRDFQLEWKLIATSFLHIILPTDVKLILVKTLSRQIRSSMAVFI